MKSINILLTQSLVQDDITLKDKNVIILDVLRATSTIAVALTNGAKEIIPTENIATAVRVAKGSKNSILCGERNGKIVDGFNLGNSPLEYSPEVIKDKSMIFTIICSGKLNDFCLEDAVCAGMLLNKLNAGKNIEFKDSEIAAANLSNDLVMLMNVPSQEKILKMFQLSEHGKYLASIGFEKDLEICSRIDSYPCIPIYRNGVKF